MRADADADLTTQELRRTTAHAVVRGAAGIGLFLGALALASYAARGELERVGTWFFERFGVAGMAFGSFLADGLHFPIPPQFYFLAAFAAGSARAVALLAVTCGSVLGGLLAFQLGRHVSRVGFVARRLAPARALVERMVTRYGYRGLIVVGILPVSYFGLCSVSGLMRLPLAAYGCLAAGRVPRLLVSYVLIAAVWEASAR